MYPSSLWILTLTCKTEHSAAIKTSLTIPFPDLPSNAPHQTWTGVLQLHDRRKATAANYSQRVHPWLVFEHGGLLHSVCPQAVVKTEESWGAVQDEYARAILSWGRTKRPSTGWAPAQHDTAGICVSGFQSHWKSRQSTPEFLLVPVTKANSGLKWSDEKISERGNVLVCVFTRGLAQRFPGQDPEIWQLCKIMRNHYNLGCWETINRLNLFSNVISPNLTGRVMHAACCYTYSWLPSCDRLSAA